MDLLREEIATACQYSGDLATVEGTVPIEQQVELAVCNWQRIDVGESSLHHSHTERLQALPREHNVRRVLLGYRDGSGPMLA